MVFGPDDRHAVFAFAYDQHGLWIENQWGTTWGLNGTAELSWDYVNNQVYEAWAIVPIAPPAYIPPFRPPGEPGKYITPSANPTRIPNPPGKIVSNCDTGIQCSNTFYCNAPYNTCSTNNGLIPCTYTQYTGGGTCNAVPAPGKNCTVNQCDTSLNYICDSTQTCVQSCKANHGACISNTLCRLNCSGPVPTPVDPAISPFLECSKFDCPSNQVCCF